ncbi:MAG: hypothetical protein CSA35_03275 [Dethiosulfovibrio peptidovorans]|nr:MAG: hypothetical protein CSA35_03275 [Dethiosulfovibrio peptidovorans]
MGGLGGRGDGGTRRGKGRGEGMGAGGAILVLTLVVALLSGSAWAVTILRVDAANTGGGDGSDWSTALNEVQFREALKAVPPANGDVEFWVKEGVYRPGTSNTDSFVLRNNVALYGGFKGDETSSAERDPFKKITVLTGDIDDNDTHDIHGATVLADHIQGTNSLHVVRSTGCGDTAILDGFTICAGAADLSGGGMGNWISSNPAVTNCILWDNGTEISHDASVPTVKYCVVEGGYTGTGNIASDPKLDPLADNSGPTLTMAIGSGSSAIKAGTWDVGAGIKPLIARDQRGELRTPEPVNPDIEAYALTVGTPSPGTDLDKPDAFEFVILNSGDVYITPELAGTVLIVEEVLPKNDGEERTMIDAVVGTLTSKEIHLGPGRIATSVRALSVIPLETADTIPENVTDARIEITLTEENLGKFKNVNTVAALMKAHKDGDIDAGGTLVQVKRGRWYGPPVIASRFISRNTLEVTIHGFRNFFSRGDLVLVELETTQGSSPEPHSSSGGGGCATGLSPASVLLALPLLFLRR